MTDSALIARIIAEHTRTNTPLAAFTDTRANQLDAQIAESYGCTLEHLRAVHARLNDCSEQWRFCTHCARRISRLLAVDSEWCDRGDNRPAHYVNVCPAAPGGHTPINLTRD